MDLRITQLDFVDSHKQHMMTRINAKIISKRLGFKPPKSDDWKVVNCWFFMIGHEEFAIWDYKGSQNQGRFSAYGNINTLRKIFPEYI